MNAKQLLDRLAEEKGWTRLPAPEGRFEDLVQAGEVQVALTADATEAKMRSAYKSHTGNQTTTLLLVAEDSVDPSVLKLLGPDGAEATQVSVAPGPLLEVIIDAHAKSSARLMRTALAQGIESISLESIAGLRVRGLGTEHLYKTRLRIADVPRWNKLTEFAARIEPSKTDWLDVVEALGYEVQERHPEYGRTLLHKGKKVAVVHSYQRADRFSRLDESGSLPEGKLLGDCEKEGVSYGFLAADSKLRLVAVDPGGGATVGRYVELDLAVLDGEDRALIGLISPEFLGGDGFESILREARDYGSRLKDRIDLAIRQQVLPDLGLAIGEWAEANGRDIGDEAQRKELEAAVLTLLFRMIFLLYAESSGFLPMSNTRYRANSVTQTVEGAWHDRSKLDPKAFSLWERFRTVVETVRTGNEAWDVPGYNGELFSASAFAGAETLEQVAFSDAVFGRVLIAIGRDDQDSDTGIDFSSLEIGHIGHIYEGLLSLSLSRADRDLAYDEKRDRYISAAAGASEIRGGQLVWTTDEGGRKAGGVYYTREELVRHLIRKGVLPGFRKHLKIVAQTALSDPEGAAHQIFDFKVIDPACGSAHFLVAVIDELSDEIAKFIARNPIKPLSQLLDELESSARKPRGYQLDDAQLLRRLIVKHCVFGVDISPMGAEIAKLSLWLASFVPGLSLVYLGRNVVVGNSLIGVSRPEVVSGDQNGAEALFANEIEVAMNNAADAAARLADTRDRTPEEYVESVAIDSEFEAAVSNARKYFDLWCAEPLGVRGSRKLFYADGVRESMLTRGDYEREHLPRQVLEATDSDVLEQASRTAEEIGFLHWPLEFPQVFAGGRGGFDAVVGNPPWEEIATGELFFYARYQPGIAALPQGEREAALALLKEARPELPQAFERESVLMAKMRGYLGSAGGYAKSAGDPDLYKLFSQRYADVLRDGGSLAVVLPRGAFQTKGSTGFREWLFESTNVKRIDFLLNSARWAFDMEPRYTIALLVASREQPEAAFASAGVADTLSRFIEQSAGDGVETPLVSLGPAYEIPLLANDEQASLLARMRETGSPFPLGGGRWACFPVGELHETNDKNLWEDATEGWPLWKGASFGQFDPHGAGARICRVGPALKKALKTRPARDSLVAKQAEHDVEARADAVAATVGAARIAFRDVTRATDGRTTIATLIPPEIFLTNKAPYLSFVDGDEQATMACLGVMNSLGFDWQARRFVEINMNFFILELLHVPRLSGESAIAIANAAAELSCIDDRFKEFADAMGIKPGPIAESRRRELRVEIDAQVALAWELSADDMKIIFSDFTEAAVAPAYRNAVLDRMEALS